MDDSMQITVGGLKRMPSTIELEMDANAIFLSSWELMGTS